MYSIYTCLTLHVLRAFLLPGTSDFRVLKFVQTEFIARNHKHGQQGTQYLRSKFTYSWGQRLHTEYVRSRLIWSPMDCCSLCLTRTLSFLPASFAFSRAWESKINFLENHQTFAYIDFTSDISSSLWLLL